MARKSARLQRNPHFGWPETICLDPARLPSFEARRARPRARILIQVLPPRAQPPEIHCAVLRFPCKARARGRADGLAQSARSRLAKADTRPAAIDARS